jgi:HK97 family phage major capsid protein
MLGMPLHTSQNVPSTITKGTSGATLSAIIFGNWSDLLIGEWGVLDLLVDPYTFSNTGGIRIRGFMTVDVNERYGAAFATIKDIITT